MTDSAELRIWRALVSTLEAARTVGGKLEFVKKVFQGAGHAMPDQVYPCIVLEPDNSDESQLTRPDGITIPFRITVSCVLLSADVEKQIVGDAKNVGILNFVAAVKNVLSADRKLGLDGVTYLRIIRTEYLYEEFPKRQADITIEVPSVATDTTR